ncbi:hypothetical protein [Rhizobium bangladeshense]|uniref:hypothetical protein n=1 Tax=Rhizobium bangladeshense TaxID=1138189 RepID=UPI0007E54F4C|nr:hypothetical protein [Rhizobium bangladeshense]
MHFLGVFAIGGLLAAAIFHVCMLLVLERLTSKINKYGPNLVTKIGKGLPQIDLQSPLIPLRLKNQFQLYRQAWMLVIAILMMPLVFYLIAKAHFGY